MVNLHEAIILATCLATMTTEKHCKLQRGCHTFAIYFFATFDAPAGNCLQLFLRQLGISCEQKTGFDCLIFTNLRGRLQWTCQTQQLVSQRCEKLRIFLLFSQLATQHFAAVAGGVTREIFLATCLATFVVRQVARKIASCNMAFWTMKMMRFATQRTRTFSLTISQRKIKPIPQRKIKPIPLTIFFVLQ